MTVVNAVPGNGWQAWGNNKGNLLAFGSRDAIETIQETAKVESGVVIGFGRCLGTSFLSRLTLRYTICLSFDRYGQRTVSLLPTTGCSIRRCAVFLAAVCERRALSASTQRSMYAPARRAGVLSLLLLPLGHLGKAQA